MSFLDQTHGKYIHKRRIERLSEQLARMVPADCDVVDVGCGDGWLAARLTEQRPDLQIRGVDIVAREGAMIPVEAFDGMQLPLADQSVDVVIMVDVLHHTEDPMVLLRESQRVARKAIILKDHFREGILAGSTLRLMDWVGNARHGVPLPFNYWTRHQWETAFSSLGLKIDALETKLGIYPFPADLLFGRGLHFVARLGPQASSIPVTT